MPGPFLDLILESLKESDKDQFRQKMKTLEKDLTEERISKGEMTRDMILKADQAQTGQYYIDYEERKLGKEEQPPKEEVPSDEKEAMTKFLEKINQ